VTKILSKHAASAIFILLHCISIVTTCQTIFDAVENSKKYEISSNTTFYGLFSIQANESII
jgi:hypothetical protein